MAPGLCQGVPARTAKDELGCLKISTGLYLSVIILLLQPARGMERDFGQGPGVAEQGMMASN